MKNIFDNPAAMDTFLAKYYYDQLSDDWNERDGVPADAEDWQRRLTLCLHYAELALHG